MRELIARIIINTAALYGTGYMLDGVTVETWGVAFFGAIIFSLLNMTIKPILKFISFPITCLTVGLFSLVINGIILYLTAALSPIDITHFGAAFLGALMVGVINWVLGIIFLTDNK